MKGFIILIIVKFLPNLFVEFIKKQEIHVHLITKCDYLQTVKILKLLLQKILN